MAASLAPMKFLSASHANLTLSTYFSTGILLGTSLLIILPEGIEVLNESGHKLTSSAIGLPLTFGFTMMYLVDKFFTIGNFPSPIVNVSPLSSILNSSLSLGLIVHGSVDGISLGSSFLDTDKTFHALVLLAIILHRIPTAFSFGTILNKKGLEDKLVVWHLALFALSTPIFTWLTIGFVSVFNTDILYVTGLLLLFSAGTFFYIVNHVMNEFDVSSSWDMPNSSDTETTMTHQGNRVNLLLPLLGLTLPVLISFFKE
ncbi:hypothetical protein KGF56_004698 [Candida oxycetoniae]|uniref:Uncharacterized protein n=1 Tax=Candida oxycetoniae TaxID=497107 RepID=A0AAI9STL3_9ASCO|nr:uncharacterized protein KGF56_004698 [Candida oxycetoniae]KAI3402606.2 hypothetical protein KGF56_004698 [Candida oxycetoniae]